MPTPTIIYASKSHGKLLERLERVAGTNAEILISGPSGVGKELYAAYVHATSSRRDKPFVAVNCANLSAEMLENEVFGHAKGAFTGALSSCSGLAAAADGGTLFLDEIDALPLVCQAKILRFVQLHEYRRLGETVVRRVNMRLIVASNADLLAKVRDGSFREDLFFRLRVVPVEIPPLAERPDDVPVLLVYFTDRFALEYEVPRIELDPGAAARLRAYAWPGNVRELENCVRYLTCLQLGRPVTVEDLPLLRIATNGGFAVAPAPDPGPDDDTADEDGNLIVGLPLKEAKSIVVEGFERLYIDIALKEARGNVTSAAQRSGKHRRAFFELMRRYGFTAGEYRLRA